MEIIDRDILKYVSEIDTCLTTFRGIRQLWAAMSANGALTAFHKFYPEGEQREFIAHDLMQEQIEQLSRIISCAKRLEAQMLGIKIMLRHNNQDRADTRHAPAQISQRVSGD